MELSEKDRLIITNQLKILEALYPDEAAEYARHRTAIEHGYELHYSWLVEHFYEPMSEKECREVLDVLDLYRALTFSIDRLGETSGVDEQAARFPGFDGNNEGKQFSYTQYFVVELGRFDELRRGAEYPDFNSHMEMLPKYRAMLDVWRGMDKSFELTAEQINAILGASHHER